MAVRLIRHARRDNSVDNWLAGQRVPDLERYRSLPRDEQVRAIADLIELRAEVLSPLDSRNLSLWATSTAVLALLVAVSGPLSPAPWMRVSQVLVSLLFAIVAVATVVADRRLGPDRSRLGRIEGRLAEFQGHLKAVEPEGSGLVVASVGRIEIHLRPPRQSPSSHPEVTTR